jgi:hypothetical protein
MNISHKKKFQPKPDPQSKLPTIEPPGIIQPNEEQQRILTLVDRMWDYIHKNISMEYLKERNYTQETIEAVSNIYHIVYNLTSTLRKDLKIKLEQLTNRTIPFGTKVCANTIALVKALIIAGLDFNKNTTYDNILEQLH